MRKPTYKHRRTTRSRPSFTARFQRLTRTRAANTRIKNKYGITLPGTAVPIITALLIGALSSTLLGTVSAQGAPELAKLQARNDTLKARSHQLDTELEKAGSLSHLATQARLLGMVPATIQGTLDNKGRFTPIGQVVPDTTGPLTSSHPITHYPPTYPWLYNARIINPPHEFPTPEQVDTFLAQHRDPLLQLCPVGSTIIDYHGGTVDPTVTCQ